jgi:oligopeptide transport system ATP-binding protein
MQQQQQQSAPALLQVEGLHKWYPLGGGWLGRPAQNVKAVNGVSFEIHRGEVLSLVGESGSGKSTIGRAILNLDPPTAGEVHFDGEPLVGLTRRQMRPLRRAMQMVFQDPYSSLNPKHTVEELLSAPLEIHMPELTLQERRDRIDAVLKTVGLNPAHRSRYPHEFSGGQRQRIGIARALMTEPQLLVADEPVSSLDVSVQAQVINLLLELKQRLGLTMLFISHDLAVVGHISDRIAVMYLGRLVEIGDAAAAAPARTAQGRHSKPAGTPIGLRVSNALPSRPVGVRGRSARTQVRRAQSRDRVHPRRHLTQAHLDPPFRFSRCGAGPPGAI